MGGSIGEGNTTVSAEFNIYADPEAPTSCSVRRADHDDGLDVTHQALLDRRAAEACARPGRRPARSPPS
jgi:inosine-uridine nucleoside N-ribohydrolase